MVKNIQHKKEKVKTPQKNIFQQSERKEDISLEDISFKEKSKGQLCINAICQRLVKAGSRNYRCNLRKMSTGSHEIDHSEFYKPHIN